MLCAVGGWQSTDDVHATGPVFFRPRFRVAAWPRGDPPRDPTRLQDSCWADKARTRRRTWHALGKRRRTQGRPTPRPSTSNRIFPCTSHGAGNCRCWQCGACTVAQCPALRAHDACGGGQYGTPSAAAARSADQYGSEILHKPLPAIIAHQYPAAVAPAAERRCRIPAGAKRIFGWRALGQLAAVATQSNTRRGPARGCKQPQTTDICSRDEGRATRARAEKTVWEVHFSGVLLDEPDHLGPVCREACRQNKRERRRGARTGCIPPQAASYSRANR
jgi:hypothetical protein